jgi:hypothetical protein
VCAASGVVFIVGFDLGGGYVINLVEVFVGDGLVLLLVTYILYEIIL